MLPTNYLLTNHTIYTYKQDLVLNIPQRLICHKAQPNQNLCSIISWIYFLLQNIIFSFSLFIFYFTFSQLIFLFFLIYHFFFTFIYCKLLIFIHTFFITNVLIIFNLSFLLQFSCYFVTLNSNFQHFFIPSLFGPSLVFSFLFSNSSPLPLTISLCLPIFFFHSFSFLDFFFIFCCYLTYNFAIVIKLLSNSINIM